MQVKKLSITTNPITIFYSSGMTYMKAANFKKSEHFAQNVVFVMFIHMFRQILSCIFLSVRISLLFHFLFRFVLTQKF